MTPLENLLLLVDYGLTPGKTIHNCALLCRHGKIYAIGGRSAFEQANWNFKLELPEYYVTPGFIDCHIYGFQEYHLTDSREQDPLPRIAEILPRHGVTSFFPTVQAQSKEKLIPILKQLSSSILQGCNGAKAEGIHLVGPYINKLKRGSVDTSGIWKKYDPIELDEIIDACQGTLKIMTLAPEQANSEDIIEQLIARGITPSMGHSAAEEKHVTPALAKGSRRVTHLFNCMTPLHQRHIGLASTALVNDNITCELIIDGYHIHHHMIDLAFRAKGAEGIIAVSVASRGAGMADGEYDFNGEKLIIDNQHLKLPGGIIAGSSISLDQAWKNLLSYNLLPSIEGIKCFTSTPANNLDIADRGHLNPGLAADLVIFNRQHEVEATIIDGQLAYCRSKENFQKIIRTNEP